MADMELYQPSLNTEDTYERKTYLPIAYLLIGAIGGPLPLIVLGTQNAYWLRVNKFLIWALICLGLVLLAMDGVLAALGGTGHDVTMWARASGIVLGTLYRTILNRKAILAQNFYQLTTVRVLFPSLLWMALGIGLEYGLDRLGAAVAHGLL